MTRSTKIMRLRVSVLGWRVLGVVLATLALVVVGGCSPAFASVLWRLDSNAAPSELVQGQQARVIATANNIGDAPVNGSGGHPVVLTDRLPSHVQVSAGGVVEGKLEASDRSEAASTLACTVEEAQGTEVQCRTVSTTQPVAAFTQLRVVIPVEAQPGAVSGEQNTVTISGGQSPSGEELVASASVERGITVGEQATPFGLERYELTPEEADGSVDVQAGSHPFQLTTTLDLNEALTPEGEGQALLEPSAPALARNLNFELPPGLLGDPQAVAQCSDADFSSIGENDVNSCPADSAIGVALVTLNLPNPPLGVFTEAVPVFNLVPAPGEPARFGLEDTKVPIILDTSVRTDGDYGVNVSIKNTTELAQLLSSQVVLWGEPQSPAHDGSRGWACIRGKEVNGETCTPPDQRTGTPFLTLPTACLGGLDTRMNGQAWSGALTETGYAFQNALGEPLASLEGCATVPFDPSIAVQPVGEDEGQAGAASVSSASTPTGLNVDVKLPAEADGLGESAVRSTTVTLPAGVQLNPSAANGLQACSEAQIGYEGAGASSDPFSPGAGEPLHFYAAPASCPDAAKVGVVRIKSPDLAHELEGGVYIAEQEHNPFGSLFALYIVAEDPVSGVRVKLAGEVTLNEQTGQATSTFADTPQVPFEHLSLRFFEGPRASLSTPPACGTYTTLASFTPWSLPTPQTSETSFPITTGPGGSPCTGSEPFQPAMQAGSASNQAGAFTSFTLTIEHPDGDQALRAISLQLPPGIAAILASVTPCPEPQAAEQRCGPQSAIGNSTAYAGLGSEPVALPGTVYLTGPYEGAPFGIEVVTPAVAGPFNLGVVTVRSRIEVNPHTAQVTIPKRPDPHHPQGSPRPDQNAQRHRQPPQLRVQPDQLHPNEHHQHAHRSAGRQRNRVRPLPGRGLPEPAVQTRRQRPHPEQDQQSRRRQPRAHVLLHPGTGKRRENRPNHPQHAPRPPDHHPESLSRQRLRSQPRRLPRRLGHRLGGRTHPRAEESADRPDLPGLPRQRRVARRRARPARRRHHRHPRRTDRDQKRRHDLQLPDGPRRAIPDRRSHPPRGTAFGADDEPTRQGPLQPVRPEPRDPHHPHRPERHRCRGEREGRGPAMSGRQGVQSEEADPHAEAGACAKGVPQEPQALACQTGRLRTQSPQDLRAEQSSTQR